MSYWQLTNILLLIIATILFVIALSLAQNRNRYSLEVLSEVREIYVFDTQTGRLFITSPEVIRDYSGEMWTQLNPTIKGRSLPFKKIIEEKSQLQEKKQFLEEIRRIKQEDKN